MSFLSHPGGNGYNPQFYGDQLHPSLQVVPDGFPHFDSDFLLSLKPKLWFDNKYMNEACWVDRISGYSVRQDTLTKRPTYVKSSLNGRDSLLFDGSNDLMVGVPSKHFQNKTGLTMWAVGNGFAFSQNDSGNVGIDRDGMVMFGGIIYGVVSNVTVSYASFTTGAINTYAVTVFDGSQSSNAQRLRMWTSGVQRTLFFNGVTPSISENAVNLSLYVGYSSQIFCPGSIYEFGMIDRVLTTEEITSLNAYLASKYAL